MRRRIKNVGELLARKGWTGRRIASLACSGAALAAIVLLAQSTKLDALVEWLRGLRGWGPVALAGTYVLTSMLLIPGLVLNVAAGALFGVPIGSAAALIGSTVGAIASFGIARTIGRKPAERWMRGDKHVRALDSAVGRSGFKVVVATRLSPGIPFNLLNYGFGLTRVSLRDFALGSLLGMIPFRVGYAVIGALLGDAAGIGGARVPKSTLEWTLLAAGAAVTVVIVFCLARFARSALQSAGAQHEA